MEVTRRFFVTKMVIGCAVTGAALLLAGCGGSGGSDDDESPTVKLGDPVTLRVGGSATVDTVTGADNVRLAVNEVVEDSRCPVDVNCVTAGIFRVDVTLSGGGAAAAQTVRVTQGTTPAQAPASGGRPGYQITLTGVSPNRQSNTTIKPDQYRMTFELTRLP